jgi:hypothetical protein
MSQCMVDRGNLETLVLKQESIYFGNADRLHCQLNSCVVCCVHFLLNSVVHVTFDIEIRVLKIGRYMFAD